MVIVGTKLLLSKTHMLSSAEKSYAKECASLRGFSATAHVGI
jgi:hypothetical protein